MNFARLLSRPCLMVDQVILCSVKGPCYGGGADLKRTDLGGDDLLKPPVILA
jgi:hypothetical protein